MAQTFDSILSDRPEKRYQEFLKTVARRGEVWTLASEVGYTTMESDGRIMLVVFPTEQYANMFCEGDFPEPIELDDFLARCREFAADADFGFMVFPNGRDAYMAGTVELLTDLQDAMIKAKA